MSKRDILVLGIIALNILDIILTHILLTRIGYTEEFNPLMRYVMSMGEWTWILFKSTIVMGVVAMIYMFQDKIRIKVLALVNALLLLVVANNAWIVVQMFTKHADLF